jgi:hippurate hydrolase
VVAIIKGQAPGPTIGLRADMDALPMPEMTGLDYASERPGRMHACGHDGHTAMLLGAATYLAETRRFAGRVALIFQPGEEQGNGAEVMVKEGVMERFGIGEVYAIHNAPGRDFGRFFATPGPMMAAVDVFNIHLKGRGGHAASPHRTADPLIAAAALAQALQTIVSRNTDPRAELVVSVTQLHAGSAENVIADSADVQGTVRVFDKDVQDTAERRISEIAQGIAAAHGVVAEVAYERQCPATVNDAGAVEKAARAARDVAGDNVATDEGRELGAEDFSFMLEARPGAYFFLGAGPGPDVHHPEYDFNDEIAPIGASYFARLVEMLQPLEA